MNITVEQTLEMPNAALFAEKLKSALEAEAQKRRRFYEMVDEDKKMEFINGEIVIHSPVKLRHNSATKLLCGLLNAFVVKNNLGFVGVEKIMVSLTRNDYEPNVCFFGTEKAKNFTPEQLRFPAPDLVVEVLSDSTVKADRETKFQDYAAHGVREYWIVDPERETIEQYSLQNERYELLLKSNSGEVKSVVLPDFQIPIRAVFDAKTNLEILSKIIA